MKKYQESIKKIFVVVKKELMDYFGSATAYIVISFFTITVGVVFSKDLFVNGLAEMRNVFDLIPLLLILVIPAVTMQSFAEEKQRGTYEILLTMPLSAMEILIAKFFANLSFALIAIVATFPIPIVLNFIGEPNNGLIIAGYFGLALLASAYVAIGQFISINSKNQVSAFLASVAVITLMFIVGIEQFLELIPASLRNIFEAISLKSHFESIAKGVIDSRDILYYFSVLSMMFYFTFRSILRIKKKGT